MPPPRKDGKSEKIFRRNGEASVANHRRSAPKSQSTHLQFKKKQQAVQQKHLGIFKQKTYQKIFRRNAMGPYHTKIGEIGTLSWFWHFTLRGNRGNRGPLMVLALHQKKTLRGPSFPYFGGPCPCLDRMNRHWPPK